MRPEEVRVRHIEVVRLGGDRKLQWAAVGARLQEEGCVAVEIVHEELHHEPPARERDASVLQDALLDIQWPEPCMYDARRGREAARENELAAVREVVVGAA